jgi:hypothetical protein
MEREKLKTGQRTAVDSDHRVSPSTVARSRSRSRSYRASGSVSPSQPQGVVLRLSTDSAVVARAPEAATVRHRRRQPGPAPARSEATRLLVLVEVDQVVCNFSHGKPSSTTGTVTDSGSDRDWQPTVWIPIRFINLNASNPSTMQMENVAGVV